MSDDILDMYGRDSGAPQKPRATTGGVKEAKPLAYSSPTGRASSTGGPGLGGDNYGCCGTQGKH